MGRRLQTPTALKSTSEAYAALETDLERVVGEMVRWPEVRTSVLAWADSLTSTNCGWYEYHLARLLLERWHQKGAR
jgi:hypothetical protein